MQKQRARTEGNQVRPIGILDGIACTVCVALMVGCLEFNQGLQDEFVVTEGYEPVTKLVRSVIYGFSLFGLLAAIRQFVRSAAPSPGHWIAACIGISTLGDVACDVACAVTWSVSCSVNLCRNSMSLAGILFFAIGVSSWLYAAIRIKAESGAPWLTMFAIGVGVQAVQLIVIGSYYGEPVFPSWHYETYEFVIFALNVLLTSMLLLAVIKDVLSGRRYDWLHNFGITMFFGATVALPAFMHVYSG